MGYSSGTYTKDHDWTTDLSGNVPVTASRMDTQHDGFATGLSTAICKDGQTTTTAAIPFAVGIRIGGGTLGTPGANFTGDTDTGIGSTGENTLFIACEGDSVMTFGTATVSVNAELALSNPLATTYGGTGIGASANSCRVYNDAAISVNSATNTALTFNTEDFDNNSLHSTASVTDRITIQTTGTYAIVGCAEFEISTANGTDASLRLSIKVDGSTYLAQQGCFLPAGAASETVCMTVMAIASLTATQYVQLEARQSTGQARNIKATAGISPVFSVARIYA